MECGVCSVGCGVWSLECGVWGVECVVWGVGCGVWSVECVVCSVQCTTDQVQIMRTLKLRRFQPSYQSPLKLPNVIPFHDPIARYGICQYKQTFVFHATQQ